MLSERDGEIVIDPWGLFWKSMITTPTRLRKGGGSSRIQPSVVSDGTATMYDTSVNKSEKRTPALTASHTGSFGQRQSVTALRERERGPLAGRAAQESVFTTGRNASVEDPKPDVRSDPGHHEEGGIFHQGCPEVDDNDGFETSLNHEQVC
jgi:hypothetical protein